MLKKLAKYGNSTTLVIDKAILELLNMDESTVVKLHTDGKSLIITPVQPSQKGAISYSPDEAWRQAAHTTAKKRLAQSSLDEETVQKIMPKMQGEFTQILARHKETMDKFGENLATNKEFQQALSLLAEKYNPETQSEEYMKEFLQLRIQFFPELAEMDKEMAAVAHKYKQ